MLPKRESGIQNGQGAHSVMWTNCTESDTHVMMRRWGPHGWWQRRIKTEGNFYAWKRDWLSQCEDVPVLVEHIRLLGGEKPDTYSLLKLWTLTHRLYHGETNTTCKLLAVSSQDSLNVYCLIRQKYSLAGCASSHCDWSLVLKNAGRAALLCPQHSACLPQDSS